MTLSVQGISRPAAILALAGILGTSIPLSSEAQTEAPAAAAGELAAAVESSVRELEARVVELERRLGSSALLELVSRLDRIAKEVQELRDLVEVQARSVDGLKRRQQDLYSELDRLSQRVARPSVESAASAAGATRVPGSGAAGAGTEPPAGTVASVQPAEQDEPGTDAAAATGGASTGVADPGTESAGTAPAAPAGTDSPYDPVEEQARYQRAFDLLSEGRFERAATAFAEFLDAFPQSRYRDTARFWKGECLYALRQFEPALEEFRTLVADHPDSPRIPGAQLKIGFILHELGRTAEAADVLRSLVETAPESSEAKLARDRLDRLN